MLVLSRRAQQRIVFPHLGISLSVLQVKGRIVKIGIEAPDSVKILRQEIDESRSDAESSVQRDAIHRRRNELNVLQLRLDAIQARIDRGEVIDAEGLMQSVLGKVSAIDHEIANADQPVRSPSSNRPKRLLVVEDCDNERGLMAYVLASHGFDVHVARDGAEALSQLQMWNTMPDFVLMDVQMPLSNGLETLHRIRHDTRLADLQIFAVTGSSRDRDNEPVGRGWDGWFQKPLNVASLIAKIRESDSSATPSHLVG
ncbi:MAG: response regulator [Pirellulaceae bacterium]